MGSAGGTRPRQVLKWRVCSQSTAENRHLLDRVNGRCNPDEEGPRSWIPAARALVTHFYGGYFADRAGTAHHAAAQYVTLPLRPAAVRALQVAAGLQGRYAFLPDADRAEDHPDVKSDIEALGLCARAVLAAVPVRVAAHLHPSAGPEDARLRLRTGNLLDPL
eukprot:9787-Rhodomonas_salina.3